MAMCTQASLPKFFHDAHQALEHDGESTCSTCQQNRSLRLARFNSILYLKRETEENGQITWRVSSSAIRER